LQARAAAVWWIAVGLDSDPTSEPGQGIVGSALRARQQIGAGDAVFNARELGLEEIDESLEEVASRAWSVQIGGGTEFPFVINGREILLHIREARAVRSESCNLRCVEAVAIELNANAKIAPAQVSDSLVCPLHKDHEESLPILDRVFVEQRWGKGNLGGDGLPHRPRRAGQHRRGYRRSIRVAENMRIPGDGRIDKVGSRSEAVSQINAPQRGGTMASTNRRCQTACEIPLSMIAGPVGLVAPVAARLLSESGNNGSMSGKAPATFV